MKREFETGANRDTNNGKYEYIGFINPLNEFSFARYMHKKRFLKDGTVRDADNWQLGIPLDALADSIIRHFHEFWLLHTGFTIIHEIEEDTGAEYTRVFTDKKEAREFVKNCDNKVEVVTFEDVLNAIRFNTEAYKLQKVFDYKKHKNYDD